MKTGEVSLMDPARCVCMLCSCYRRRSPNVIDGLCAHCRADYVRMRQLYQDGGGMDRQQTTKTRDYIFWMIISFALSGIFLLLEVTALINDSVLWTVVCNLVGITFVMLGLWCIRLDWRARRGSS